MQAERAVEALSRYLPQQATVLRDGEPVLIETTGLVPGDIVVLEEEDRIAADIRLLSSDLEVDMSTLTGESVPVVRSAELTDLAAHRLDAPDLVFSGSTCTRGETRGVVFATGMHTQLGRIAALSERVKERPSPLEAQVHRVAWLIAAIAVGLLAGHVPEGLLPVITLALAIAVTALARRGALVKRLSAVETLGSTDVVCTDKTGTLTENRMRPMTVWTTTATAELGPGGALPTGKRDAALTAVAETAAACNNAFLQAGEPAQPDGGDPLTHGVGDPTEVAVLAAAHLLGANIDPAARELERRHAYEFDRSAS